MDAPLILIQANIYVEFPKGSRVISTEGHGVSFWANTGQIDIELEDGTPQTFFIKILSKDVGKDMVHGEYESLKAIHTVLPDFAPKPTPTDRTNPYLTRTFSCASIETRWRRNKTNTSLRPVWQSIIKIATLQLESSAFTLPLVLEICHK